MTHVVVIGAGQAGASLVAKLRKNGFEGRITLMGSEPIAPYQRPPLSKKYLLGEIPRERLLLRPESFYADNAIDLRLGTEVRAIDRHARTIELDDGRMAYDSLVLATGSLPRRLPPALGGDLAGVHVARSVADMDGMAGALAQDARLLVVGGGYIGLETAAVAAARGLRVTLIEAGERILQRVAARQTSDYFRALHRSHGVDIREGVGLECLLGDRRVHAARLNDGTTLEVDRVVVGIGIMPATTLAEHAGLDIDNGIAVDAFGRTSDPSIWAIGDCASFPFRGGRIRLESVPNAIDMAECVAGNIMGAKCPYVPQPWFWSEQYDVKLQIAGLNTGYNNVVARSSEREGAASYWYFRGRQLLAVDAANDPRVYMVGRKLLGAGRSPEPQVVADPQVDLLAL